MEVMLSQYQAVVLNRAIDLFRTRKIGRTTLIDDAYVLQKQLAVWISANTPQTGNSSSTSIVTASARLAFNMAINDNGSSTPPPPPDGDPASGKFGVGSNNLIFKDGFDS